MPTSQEQARLYNMARLLALVLDVSFGTLWKVRERVWKKFSHRYDQNSDRFGHPAVSLRTAPLAGDFERVPMLHGTSGDDGPVVIRGLTMTKGPEYPTSFGHLLVPVPASRFLYSIPDPTDDNPERELPDVLPNAHKLRASDVELARLAAWARNRNLIS